MGVKKKCSSHLNRSNRPLTDHSAMCRFSWLKDWSLVAPPLQNNSVPFSHSALSCLPSHRVHLTIVSLACCDDLCLAPALETHASCCRSQVTSAIPWWEFQALCDPALLTPQLYLTSFPTSATSGHTQHPICSLRACSGFPCLPVVVSEPGQPPAPLPDYPTPSLPPPSLASCLLSLNIGLIPQHAAALSCKD